MSNIPYYLNHKIQYVQNKITVRTHIKVALDGIGLSAYTFTAQHGHRSAGHNKDGNNARTSASVLYSAQEACMRSLHEEQRTQ